jgi:plastocyanin
MNLRCLIRPLISLILLAGVASAGHAATTVNVTVGANGALSFSPKTVTINVGDSVKFTNAGGSHNVKADNNSFRCARGCDDTGGSGGISGTLWTFTRTFNTAGTVAYYCENHGAPGGNGMAGSIVVNDVAPPPPPKQNIVAGLSGNWFNPTANQGGHGFQIEILPNNGILAIWFVFNPAGTAQNWIYLSGPYDPNSNDVAVPAFLEQGGAFPPNFDATKLTAPPWGLLEFKFSDCNNGTAEYTPNEAAVNAGYGHVTFPIQRLTSIVGTTCP